MKINQITIEQTVLASFIKDNSTEDNYKSNLKYLQDINLEIFESREHQHILKILQLLDQNNYDLESLIIESKLNEKAQKAYIDIITATATANVYNYIKMLNENHQKNSLSKEIINLKKQLSDDQSIDTARVIEKLESLQNIKSSTQKKKRDTKFKESWKAISTNRERLDKSEEVEYINKTLVKGEVTMLAGAPGRGKSLHALAEIVEALENNNVEEVFYLDMDNSESTLAERDLAGVAEKFEDRLFYVLGSTCTKIELDRKIRELCNTELTNCLVVFDSAKNFMRGGDRDKNRDVSKITEIFKALRNNGATVKFLHHTNKPQKDFDMMFAGSSAWLEDATNAYILDRNEEKETFILKNIKTRTGKIPKEIAYKINNLKLEEVEIKDAKRRLAQLKMLLTIRLQNLEQEDKDFIKN